MYAYITSLPEDDSSYRLDDLTDQARRSVVRRMAQQSKPHIAGTPGLAGNDDIDDLINRCKEVVHQLQSAAQDALAATYSTSGPQSESSHTDAGRSRESCPRHAESTPQTEGHREKLYDDVMVLLGRLHTAKAQSERGRDESNDKRSMESQISQYGLEDDYGSVPGGQGSQRSYDSNDAWSTESQASSEHEGNEDYVEGQDEYEAQAKSAVAGRGARWQRIASAELVVKGCCIQ